MLTVALSVGFGLSYYALTDGRLFAAQKTGDWATWPEIGSPTPDPYTRAFLSRLGILPLGSSEGNQFVASVDHEGRALSASCTYSLTGTTPLATFWTLVAVDPDGKNIAPKGAQLFLDSAHLSRSRDGFIMIKIGKKLAAQNWLEVESDEPYQLLLTLYDSTAFADDGSRSFELPTIINEGCL